VCANMYVWTNPYLLYLLSCGTANCIVICFVGGVISILKMKASRSLDEGAVASATIVEKNHMKKDNHETFTVCYSFTTPTSGNDGKMVSVRDREVDAEVYNRFSQGSSAPVLYVPWSPGTCRLQDQKVEDEKINPAFPISVSFCYVALFCVLAVYEVFFAGWPADAVTYFWMTLACCGCLGSCKVFVSAENPFGGQVTVTPTSPGDAAPLVSNP